MPPGCAKERAPRKFQTAPTAASMVVAGGHMHGQVIYIYIYTNSPILARRVKSSSSMCALALEGACWSITPHNEPNIYEPNMSDDNYAMVPTEYNNNGALSTTTMDTEH